MTLLIGFSGRAKHGKTECCEGIKQHVESEGGTAAIYDIGDMIRRYCIETGRLPQIERKDMNREQLTLMIYVGREKRAIDENFWIDQVFDRAAKEKPDVALCPNLRYRNEAEMFKQKGAFVVRVQRLNENGSVYISDDRPPNDPLETELEFWSADFYLTGKPGQIALVKTQALCIYEFLKELQRGKK